MVNKILESINNVSMTNGRYLSDKTYKYDTIVFVSKYIYDLAGGLSSFEITNDTMANLVKRIAADFTLPEGSFDSNRNYILETLSFLQYANVIEKTSSTSYRVVNYDSLDFITVSIENAYIFQYLVAYQTFVNDGLWDLYLDYIKPDEKDVRKAKLMKIKDIMCSKSVSIGDPDSVWALNVVKFSIMVLGLANDDNKVTRTLDIKDERITPSLSHLQEQRAHTLTVPSTSFLTSLETFLPSRISTRSSLPAEAEIYGSSLSFSPMPSSTTSTARKLQR